MINRLFPIRQFGHLSVFSFLFCGCVGHVRPNVLPSAERPAIIERVFFQSSFNGHLDVIFTDSDRVTKKIRVNGPSALQQEFLTGKLQMPVSIEVYHLDNKIFSRTFATVFFEDPFKATAIVAIEKDGTIKIIKVLGRNTKVVIGDRPL